MGFSLERIGPIAVLILCGVLFIASYRLPPDAILSATDNTQAQTMTQRDYVLVDDLGHQCRIVGPPTPGVDGAPANLGIALVVGERDAGQAGVVVADILDDLGLALDDLH